MNRVGCRAERLPQPDLARALAHGDQHDVHDADAAERERDEADGEEEILHALNHPAEHHGLDGGVPQ